jgi:hypothetical protein
LGLRQLDCCGVDGFGRDLFHGEGFPDSSFLASSVVANRRTGGSNPPRSRQLYPESATLRCMMAARSRIFNPGMASASVDWHMDPRDQSKHDDPSPTLAEIVAKSRQVAEQIAETQSKIAKLAANVAKHGGAQDRKSGR